MEAKQLPVSCVCCGFQVRSLFFQQAAELGDLLLDYWGGDPFDISTEHRGFAARREWRGPLSDWYYPESPDYHRMGLAGADRPATVSSGTQGYVGRSLH